MTSEQPREPFWTVQAIFDPDGLGGDFSYTDGLRTRGLPELHIYARPTDGTDPGADWKLSLRDTGHLLNELAWLWLDGDLHVGSELTRDYDSGLTRLRLRVQPPGDKERLEAYQTHPDAQVVPITWSLERAAAGPLRPMEPDAQAAAEARLTELTETLEHHGSTGIPAADWAPDSAFGPRTPVVLALSEVVRRALRADRLAENAMLADTTMRWGWPLATVQAAARPVGRQDAVQSAMELGRTLASEQAEALLDWFVGPSSPEERAAGREQVVDHIGRGLGTALAAEVVADVLPREAWLGAVGPVLAAGRAPGVPVSQEFVARGEVVPVVDDWLMRQPPAALAEVCRRQPTLDGEDVIGVLRRALSLSFLSAAAWWPQTAGWNEHQRAIEEACAEAGADPRWLHELASCLTAMLVHDDAFGPDDVLAFSSGYRDVLPDLATLWPRG